VSGDRLIRGATAAVVTCVAGFAAVVSYSHIYDLGRAHGGSGTAARLLPLSVDGLILAASLVLLHEARARRPAPPLARCMLALGVAATLAANVAYGAVYGALGAVIWAWPAVAFIGAVETGLGLVRRRGHQVAARPPGPLRPAVPTSKEEAAIAAFAASVTGGNPLSERALSDRFDLSRTAARRIRTGMAAANGQARP
jgi:hypothetical protein